MTFNKSKNLVDGNWTDWTTWGECCKRESFSLFGQTTYNFSDSLRLVTGLRYSEDKVNSDVSNFFGEETFLIDSKMDKTSSLVDIGTGKIYF